MADNSFEFDEVQEDSQETTTTSSSGSDEHVRVDMTFGVNYYTPEKHDCVQCGADMDKVVIVDTGPIEGTKMNREVNPVCEDHVDEVVQINEEQGHDVMVRE